MSGIREKAPGPAGFGKLQKTRLKDYFIKVELSKSVEPFRALSELKLYRVLKQAETLTIIPRKQNHGKATGQWEFKNVKSIFLISKEKT